LTYLPPATLAAIHGVAVEGEAEAQTGDLIGAFVSENKLHQVKQDFRHYGFNHESAGNPVFPSDIVVVGSRRFSYVSFLRLADENTFCVKS